MYHIVQISVSALSCLVKVLQEIVQDNLLAIGYYKVNSLPYSFITAPSKKFNHFLVLTLLLSALVRIVATIIILKKIKLLISVYPFLQENEITSLQN